MIPLVRPEDAVFAPVLLPLIGAAIAFCAKAFLKDRRARILEYTGVFIGLFLPWASFVQTFPLVIGGDAVQGIVGSWYGGVGIMYRFDGLAWLVNLLGFSVAGAAWIYTLGAGPRGPAFSGIFLIQTAALAATIMTADLFNLFVCLEVLGIASYVLVASSDKPGASLASFSYLMVSAAAMVFFLLGLYGFYRLTGSLSYTGIAQGLAQLPDSGGYTALLSLALVTAAVAIRVAVMPLYGWLPDAHALAPHAVSAVLSGVLIKTPLFALARILVLMPAGNRAGQLIGYAGAATALVAVVIALSQKDAKRLLAYHSISQIGYIVSAWGAAVHLGTHTKAGILLMSAAFLHAFYHALFKGLLFLSVGTAADCAGERNVYKLREAGSMLKASGEKIPVTMICFFIGALAISAIPPLNGYASKTVISYTLKDSPHYLFLYAAGIGTVASFIKLSRIYWPGSKGKKQNETDDEAVSVDHAGIPKIISKKSWRAIQLSQMLLGSFCIIGGLAASRIFGYVVRLTAGFGTGGMGGMGETGAVLTGAGDLSSTAAADSVAAAVESILASGDFMFYSLDNLLKILVTAAAGTVLFFLAVSEKGSALLTKVRERPRNFRGLFVSFALGTAALAGWLIF